MFKDDIKPDLPPPPPPPRPYLDDDGPYIDNRPNGQPGPCLEHEPPSGDDGSAGEQPDTLSQDNNIESTGTGM